MIRGSGAAWKISASSPSRRIGYETRVYHLSAGNVSFRRKMQLSDDERARRALNMQNAHRNRRSSVNLQGGDDGNERDRRQCDAAEGKP